MKSNWIVIGGIVVVIASAFFLPVISFTQQASYINGIESVSLNERSGVLIGIVLLLLTLLKWKWRGILWIVLGVIGAIWTPTSANTLYEVGKKVGVAMDPSFVRGEPSYEIGLYVILLGYAIVIGGSIWEIIQQKNSQSTVSETK
jgi:hypothetical protein